MKVVPSKKFSPLLTRGQRVKLSQNTKASTKSPKKRRNVAAKKPSKTCVESEQDESNEPIPQKNPKKTKKTKLL